MANITERKGKDGTTSYYIRVSRGRGLKPFHTTWTPQAGWSKSKVRKELNKFAIDFENECKKGNIAIEKKSFGAYAEYVIDLKESGDNIKPRTAERYRQLLARINDLDCNGFGYLKLTDIRAEHLNKFYTKLAEPGMNKMYSKKKAENEPSKDSKKKKKAEATNKKPHEEKGLSPKTIREHHRLISMVFSQAVKEGLVLYNIAERGTPPKVQRKEAEHYELDLIRDILEALESEDLKWQCLINVMIASGARLGEVMGLRWNCVDFENSRILIKNNLQYLPSKGVYETTTKTGEKRYITLPASTMKLLRAWKAQQRQISGVLTFNGFCFTTADGIKPMHPQSVKCFLDRFAKRHGLPHLHAHAFRHTQASLLIASGTDIVSVAKRLGHADTTTTMNIYAHELAKADKRSSDVIGNLIYKEG